MKVDLKNLLNKKNLIKYEELKYLNELLKSELPIKTCFSLIKDNRNEKAIDLIIKELDEGKMIENIINNHLPKEVSTYMFYLLKTLTFSKSLDLALNYYEKSKDNLEFLTKQIAYPILLLFASITGLYLFNNYGFDSIVQMMKSFKINLTGIKIMRVFMGLLTDIFYVLMIIVLTLFLYFKSPKRISIAYILMCKNFPIEFIKTYFTEDFMSLYILTTSLGYKTKDTLSILKSLKNKPIVSLIAFHIDEKLMEGNSLKSSTNIIYIDQTLNKFINIASYSKNGLSILNGYVEFASKKIMKEMKTVSSIVQIVSYVLIGFVIIFIYQILFLPMQALNML